MRSKFLRIAAITSLFVAGAAMLAIRNGWPGLDGASGLASNSAPQISSASKTHATVTSENSGAAVTLHIDTGWHVYANPPSAPYLIPASVTAQRNGHALIIKPRYPPGEDIGLRINGRTILVYEDGTRIGLPGLTNLRGVRVLVRVQACDNKGLCLPPATITAVAQ